MSTTRRQFLKIAGLAAFGLGTSSALDAADAVAKDMPGAKYEVGEKHLAAKRWAMVIDTRKLESREDFERIIHACHTVHNVPSIPNKQEIKWIWTDKYDRVFTDDMSQHLSPAVREKDYLLLCNHCENPPCVRVCPTKATFKRADGIVVMDYHRCIGCRFCMAGCPYGARSFNFGDPRPYLKDVNPAFPTRMRGVVEKCTFCSERLEVGLQPACVEASNGAILFGDLDDPNSPVRKALAENFSIRRKPSIGTQPGVYYIV
ncbi:sulfate reduction electron transfer complex DsrMKJOP subunit DsrO [Nitratidesulfovibrio sp. D1]|uniref:sulfate reduction electron transfer complex DsrMKJOP subunit DsrO n=1 Tax=Nitratidesulfovibrio sp. D1 TaxID=3440151 RepID=UPI003EBE476B